MHYSDLQNRHFLTHEFLHGDLSVFEDQNSEIPEQNMQPERKCVHRKLMSILYENQG